MKNKNMSRGAGSASGKKLIIANWKMNLSIIEAVKYVNTIKKHSNQVVLAAPFTFLNELKSIALNKGIKLAGQNVSAYLSGAYTGEISAKMLKDVGCSYCIIGHSERRVYFQENDTQVNQKIKNVLDYKIIPIICIGETASQKSRGLSKQVIKTRLVSALKGIKNVPIIIAYEPIWAISTFQKTKKVKSAEINDIVTAHDYIYKLLNTYTNQGKVIYGGTVNPQNSKEILGLKQVDGVLVGGASLKVSSFNVIIQNT